MFASDARLPLLALRLAVVFLATPDANEQGAEKEKSEWTLARPMSERPLAHHGAQWLAGCVTRCLTAMVSGAAGAQQSAPPPLSGPPQEPPASVEQTPVSGKTNFT
jgi:hypothetical protein